MEWLKSSTKKCDDKGLGFTQDEQDQEEKASFLEEILWEELNGNERQGKKGIFTGMNPVEALIAVLDGKTKFITNRVKSRVIDELRKRLSERERLGQAVPVEDEDVEAEVEKVLAHKRLAEQEREEASRVRWEFIFRVAERGPESHTKIANVLYQNRDSGRKLTEEEIARECRCNVRTVQRFKAEVRRAEKERLKTP